MPVIAKLTQRGARGQVIADETGPAPARRQPGRGRIGRQGPGEAGDEVLVTPVRRAGPEQVTGPRSGGQPGRPAGIRRCDRHHPRRRAADMHCHTPAVPGDVAAAQRHQLAGPQPGADAEHHHRQRRGPVHRIALASGDGRHFRALGRRVRRRRPGARERRRPLPRLAVHRPREPVQRRPVGAPGGRRAAGQAGHAERLDHVIIQQELPAGRDPPRRGEPAQPAHRRASHGLPPRFRRIAREHRGAHTCLPAQ